jgi:hypothetical protein
MSAKSFSLGLCTNSYNSVRGDPNETAPAAGPRPDSPCRTGREDFRRPEIKIGGEDLVIMTEGDVMGVIDQTGAKKKAA